MAEHPLPEMLRLSLQDLALRIVGYLCSSEYDVLILKVENHVSF